MDTDDICLPSRFEKQIDFISKNPDVVLLGDKLKNLTKQCLILWV